MRNANDKGLRPGMWCKTSDREEWLAVIYWVSHLGLTPFPPEGIWPTFETHPWIIVCQALPDFPMIQPSNLEKLLKQEDGVSVLDFMVRCHDEAFMRDTKADVSGDVGREPRPDAWWMG